MCVLIGILLGGLALLTSGIYARLGGYKELYLPAPLMSHHWCMYTFIPGGLIISMFALYILIYGEDFLNANFTIFYILVGFFLITALYQPRWMLPRWLNYLRDTYGYEDTYYLLLEARKNRSLWLEKVETHEGLVAWAEETIKVAVRMKYRR